MNNIDFKKFEEYVYDNGYADNIGYFNNISEYFLNDFKIDYNSAIVFILKIDQEVIDKESGFESKDLNYNFYEKFGNYINIISEYLKNQGIDNYPVNPRMDDINLVKLAEDAGLGAIGHSGLLITPENGPNQKISAILLNSKKLPKTSNEKHLWIHDYCNDICDGYCATECSSNALKQDEKDISFLKDDCIGSSEGCTVCISECSFYKKSYGEIMEEFNEQQ